LHLVGSFFVNIHFLKTKSTFKESSFSLSTHGSTFQLTKQPIHIEET